MHQTEPERDLIATDDDSLYPYVNNDIKYRLFEDIVDSYYLDSQIKDDFQCDHDCYSQYRDPTHDNHSNACTHDYHHITQSVQDLTDSTQQNTLHSMEENTSLFADDTDTHCDFSIADHIFDTENANDTHTCFMPKYLPFTHKENTYTETLLVMHTYSTMTLTIKIPSHTETNIQHYYNKNDKTLLEFAQPNNDQKLPNFQGHGHKDNATCNVFHRRFRHSYQNQSRTVSDNRI